MPAWSLKASVLVEDLDWFEKRLSRARSLASAAGVSSANNFDTIIGDDFGGTIASELVTDSGGADASPSADDRAGVVVVTVGSESDSLSRARLQLTGSSEHVTENFWYVAALVKMNRLALAELGETECDAVGLWADNNNRAGIGILGNASGGSTTNWVAYADADAGFTTIIGPALDPEEAPTWHLFEMWTVDNETVHAAIDGVDFANTISVDEMPAAALRLSPTYMRSATGNSLVSNVDKYVVIVRSPTVGSP